MSTPLNAQTAGFFARVIECLPRMLTSAEMQRMIENPKLLKSRLEIALCSLEHVAWTSVVMAPRSGNKLSAAVMNSRYTVKASAQKLLEEVQLKPSHTSQTVELVLWTATQLGIDSASEWSMADVQRRMQLLNLSFCTLELALEVSVGLSEVRGQKFIPFTTDDENRGGILGIDGSFYGNETSRRYELECYDRDYWRNISFNPDIPLVLVRQLSSLDNANLASVFSETLCDSLEISSSTRTRLLRVFENENIQTLSDLMKKSESYLRRVPNFGDATMDAVQKVLNNFGLELPRYFFASANPTA